MNILLVAKTILKTFLQALSLIGAGPRRLLSGAVRLTPCGSALPLSNVAFPLSTQVDCRSSRKGATHQSVLGHQALPGTYPLSHPVRLVLSFHLTLFAPAGPFLIWFSQYLRLPTLKLLNHPTITLLGTFTPRLATPRGLF